MITLLLTFTILGILCIGVFFYIVVLKKVEFNTASRAQLSIFHFALGVIFSSILVYLAYAFGVQ